MPLTINSFTTYYTPDYSNISQYASAWRKVSSHFFHWRSRYSLFNNCLECVIFRNTSDVYLRSQTLISIGRVHQRFILRTVGFLLGFHKNRRPPCNALRRQFLVWKQEHSGFMSIMGCQRYSASSLGFFQVLGVSRIWTKATQLTFVDSIYPSKRLKAVLGLQFTCKYVSF